MLKFFTRLAEHNKVSMANKPTSNYRQGGAGGGGNYNPGRMEATRREHDDRDRRDYGEAADKLVSIIL